MDRTAWIAIAIATIGLVASMYWQQRQMVEARARYLQQQAALAAQATPPPQPAQTPASATPSYPTTQSPVADQSHQDVPEKDETLKSAVSELHFSNNRGGLATVDLLNHRAEGGQLVQLNTDRTPAIGAITQNPNSWQDGGYDLSTDSAAGTATLKRTIADGLEITKVYTLSKQAGLKDDYQIRLAITFKNNGSSTFETPGFFVSTGTAEPIHRTDRIFATQFDWYRDGKFNSIAVNYFDPAKILGLFQTSGPRDVYSATADKILWAAVSNQYFATILAPQDTDGTQVWATPVNFPTNDGRAADQGYPGRNGDSSLQLAFRRSQDCRFQHLCGAKRVQSFGQTPERSGRHHEFRLGEMDKRTLADRDERAACMGEELCTCHHHHDNHHPVTAMATPERGDKVDAQDGETFADHERASREVQRRPPAHESGDNEAVQGVWRQSVRRLPANARPDPNLFRLLRHARQSHRASKQLIPVGS